MRNYFFNETDAYRAYVLEAEIFAQLSTSPENVRLFADYLKYIEEAYADVTREEAIAAGKAAGEAKTELGLAYADFYKCLQKRPHIAAAEEAQELRLEKLYEVEGIRDLMRQFHRLAICFEHSRRLDVAFCEGYCFALAECPIQPNEFLNRPAVLTAFQNWLLELSGDNHHLLLAYSEKYPPYVDEGVILSKKVFAKLNEAERIQFDQWKNAENEWHVFAERHFFLRGVEIAIKQACGLPTPGLLSLDYDMLFGCDRLDLCMVDFEVPHIAQNIRAKLKNKLITPVVENRIEIEYRLQSMALLRGYRLATDLLCEHYPDFEESVPFTTLLASAVLSYIT